jgi:hypothetical protein
MHITQAKRPKLGHHKAHIKKPQFNDGCLEKKVNDETLSTPMPSSIDRCGNRRIQTMVAAVRIGEVKRTTCSSSPSRIYFEQ